MSGQGPSDAPTNRLAGAYSPYLQQHARNPVDWYPWGEEALERARREDKPLLVSIGYSTCHWCHVMARESFEDPAIAGLMNEHFVSIKVDREERPDLDRIYQQAHRLLSGRPGGWPLTVFLTPDQTPFFAGTYFPPQSMQGLPSFRELLEAVHGFYHRERERIEAQNEEVRKALAAEAAPAAGRTPDPKPLYLLRRALAEHYDRERGGFGDAPKFPHHSLVEFQLRQGAQGDAESRECALHALGTMAESGLYDHLGGGFFRYCVDAEWSVPHFEKMLYDNGQLLPLYADAWRLTGEGLFRRAAEETAEWVVREMELPGGGFASALDAESEGEEGAFYRFDGAELRSVLGGDAYRVASSRYGLDGPPNFEGYYHLRAVRPLDEVAAEYGIDEATAAERLEAARTTLLEVRAQRVRPGRDDKALVSWNALMIRGLGRAGRVLARDDLIEAADRALERIRRDAWRDGRLLAVAGGDPLKAYLDDYAFLLDALLERLRAGWRDDLLDWARELADAMLQWYADPAGGFFFTASDHEALLQRPKPWSDESLPSGNAVAAKALGRLGHLLGESRYLEAADGTVQAAGSVLAEEPHIAAAMVIALEDKLEPPEVVVLRGDAAEARRWRAQLERDYVPRRLVFVVPAEAAGPPGGPASVASGVTAQVCTGQRCLGPVTEEPELARLLTRAAG
ncbi:MAG TPA: thioredoxin domain-containing protein [Gammaproteobacteria bacterium]|nr:thioredoxin domain-containing protein [Gammaproteobacteria bacterium]